MNLKKRKTAFVLLAAVLCAIILLGIRGTRKTIDKTVPARVYEDNSTTYAPSSITISGTLKKTWSSTSFVGTFAMDGYEPSCRDGVEAKINWGDNEYPILTFFYAGNFSQLDVKSIDIDKDMDRMMVTLNDGTIIASENYFAPRNAERQLTQNLPCRLCRLRRQTGKIPPVPHSLPPAANRPLHHKPAQPSPIAYPPHFLPSRAENRRQRRRLSRPQTRNKF